MPSPSPSPSLKTAEETIVFIHEGTHRLAAISMNDYGFLMSARMAQSYLGRALDVLDAKRGLNRECFTELSVLKSMAREIAREYAQFEAFCGESDQFDRLQPKDWKEWTAKLAVRVISRKYRGTMSHYLAYKIRTFHSRMCLLLAER